MKRVKQKNEDEKPISDGETNPDDNLEGTRKTVEGGKQTSFVNWKLVDRLAKLFFVFLILLLCWNVLQSMFVVPVSRVERRASQRVVKGNQRFADFTNGSWSFGDGDWELRVFPETKENGLLDKPTFHRDPHPQFDDGQYIEMLRNIGATPTPINDGFELWRSKNLNGFSVVMFTRGSVVQLVRTRFPTETGISIVEGRPKAIQPEDAKLLLPLSGGVKQIASRIDDQDRLVSAILDVDNTHDTDIRVVWANQGWDVRPLVGLVSPRGNENVKAARYRCTKDDVIVEATFFLDDSNQPSQILLIRLGFGSG